MEECGKENMNLTDPCRLYETQLFIVLRFKVYHIILFFKVYHILYFFQSISYYIAGKLYGTLLFCFNLTKTFAPEFYKL